MLNKAAIVDMVGKLNLPCGEYWVASGAGLVLHGVREYTHDIDIGCTAKVMDALLSSGCPLMRASDGTRKTTYGDMIEFFEDWRADEVEIVDGVHVASILSIRKQKSAMGREKDLRDIALIDEYVDNMDKRNN